MKKVITTILVMLVFNLTYSQISQDKAEKLISSDLSECMDKHMDTQGSVECILKATEQWDKLLNKYYGMLKNKLSDDGKKKLLEAQREWIKMRDKEFAFIDQLYQTETGGGTMYTPIALLTKKDYIKERALELKYYCGELDEQ